MLDEIEPAQFDEWVAWRELEHDADERLREVVKRGFAAVVSWMLGKEIKPDEFDRWAEPEKPQALTPDQAVAAIRQCYGR